LRPAASRKILSPFSLNCAILSQNIFHCVAKYISFDNLAYRGLEEVMDKFNICHRDFEKMIIQLFGELEKAKELVNLVEKR
jgi:hypothetical protein